MLFRRRPRLVLATIAIGALLAAVPTAAHTAQVGAVAAKKKRCPVGFAKVRVKDKRKCRPAAGPRATLTWTNSSGTGTDVDLLAWDALGNQNGLPGFAGIPNTEFSIDSQTFGPEVFVDDLTPATRNFTFGACMSNDNGTDDTVATLVFRPPDGSTQTVRSLPGQLAEDHSFVLLYLGSFNPGPAPACG